MNIMIVEGRKAKIEYDPEIDMFRGEILTKNIPVNLTCTFLLICTLK